MYPNTLLHIDGQWCPAASGRTLPVVNPADHKQIGTVAYAEKNDLDRALDAADKGFKAWRKVSAFERCKIMRKAADLFRERADTVAEYMTFEQGKPVGEAKLEALAGADLIDWFAEEGRRAYGRVIPPQADGKRNLVIKTPIGVVAAISPWNFPLMLAVRKVAPALAAGCPVVLKPARQTPLSCVAFAECVHAAQLPKGVFQLVCGKSDEFGAEFIANPLCRKVTFTGSTEVGRVLIANAAHTIKPLSLELGGHAPLLVFEDADFDVAIEGALLAKMRNTGQSCIAANRLLVHRPIYDKFLEAFVARVKALKVGEFSEPGVEIDPLIDEAALRHALEQVQDAVQRGARLLCGGRRLDRNGFFFEPTVLADVPTEALCMCEETFAPVAPVLAFDTEAEAIQLANQTPYGLSAYAFTREAGRIFRLGENLEAGMIGINDGLPTTSNAPFGGVKQSGWGRELGSEGLDAFLETKHLSIRI